VIENDIESCGSRAVQSHANPRHHRQKLEVYNEVLRRIQDSDCEDALVPGFDDQLWLHFNRLPARFSFSHFSHQNDFLAKLPFKIDIRICEL
jgi:hypothetical protein